MDYNLILQAVSSLGFPIVMCGLMAWFVMNQTNKHREEIEKLNDRHKEEMKSVTEALNNNTLAIQELTDKLGKED